MTSRDGNNRNRPMSGAPQSRAPQRQDSNWELDADELDRYMSGQPSREPRFDPYGRAQTDGRTERQPVQQQQQPPRQPRPQQQPARQTRPLQPQYDDFASEPEEDWVEDDFGYEADTSYDDFQAEPSPVRQQPPVRQNRPVQRTRQPEPESDDDLYEDPYLLDDEEVEERPQRRAQRPNRARPQRQAPNFTLPPAIANAAIVKDRMALIMAGVGLLSLIVMVIVVLTQRDSLADVIFTHVNANGEPANLRSSDAIWNLPLIAGMVLLISAIGAWFLARWDQFLPRFLLGGSIGVHFVAWVAVIAYLF